MLQCQLDMRLRLALGPLPGKVVGGAVLAPTPFRRLHRGIPAQISTLLVGRFERRVHA